MSLSLKESQAVSELAAHLYDYLPGTPHPYADHDLSFPGAAEAVGVGRFWQGRSKQPAITKLLSLTLEHRRDKFCPLIEAIVHRALPYRRKDTPLHREEIEELNRLVATVGFKIPDLWDDDFLDGLPRKNPPGSPSKQVQVDTEALEKARQHFASMQSLPPQERGYEFERFLIRLFEAWGMEPRAGFRRRGEQIDGSFMLDGDTYLVEARWRNQPTNQSALMAFSGKVAGKSEWSRGLFVSYSGFTDEGLDAFSRNRPTNLVCISGLDLHHTLDTPLDWREVIRKKARRAAETGHPFITARELFPALL